MLSVTRVLAVLPLGLIAVGQTPVRLPQKAVQVVVVVSQDAPPYRAALTGFQRALAEKGQVDLRVLQLDGDSTRASQVMGSTPKANLVLTLGTLATRETLRRYRGVPTVAGMILSPDEIQGASNTTGVFLQFPVETELEWLSRIVPSIHRVGIIYHSDESKARVQQAEKLAPAVNLNIQAYQIDRPQELPDALENLADRADALWGVTDPMVFNPETAKSLLLFSFRHQIPLIGHSTRRAGEQDSRWPGGRLAASCPAAQGALHPEPEDRGTDEARAARPHLPRRRGSGGVRSGDALPPTQHSRQAAAAHHRGRSRDDARRPRRRGVARDQRQLRPAHPKR
jgi:putative ABC transport system substrate-binding protein